MCMMALAVAQFAVGALGAVAQHQAAMDQYEEDQRRYQENARLARERTKLEYERRQQVQNSEKEKTAMDNFRARLEGKRMESKALAAAGEGGVMGMSVTHLLADLNNQSSAYTEQNEENLSTAFIETRMAMENAHLEGQSQINSVPRPVKPSFAGAAVRILGSAVSAFGKA